MKSFIEVQSITSDQSRRLATTIIQRNSEKLTKHELKK